MFLRLTENHVVALNFALIAGIAFAAAQVVNDIVEWRLISMQAPPIYSARPPRRAGRPYSRSEFQLIVERDIFNKVKQVHARTVVKAVDLHLRLLGTSQLSRSRPYAVVEDEITRKQSLYRLQDEIPGVGRIVGIEKNRILIDRGGQLASVEMPPAAEQAATPSSLGGRALTPYPGVRQVGTNHWQINRSTVDRSLQNMGQLLMQARATPNLRNGKIEGFRLSEIQPGSIFSQLGLQNGDIITEVEGQEVNDPARALEMLSLLRDRPSISLTVMRNGQPVQLNFDIR